MSEVKALLIGQKWVAPHGTVFKVLGDIRDGCARVKVSSLSDEDRTRYDLRFDEPGGNIISKFCLVGGVYSLTLKEKKTLWIADDGTIVESQGKVHKTGSGGAEASVVFVECGKAHFRTPGAASVCFSLYGPGCPVQFRKMKRAEVIERKLTAAHREIADLRRALHDVSRIARHAAESCGTVADKISGSK